MMEEINKDIDADPGKRSEGRMFLPSCPGWKVTWSGLQAFETTGGWNVLVGETLPRRVARSVREEKALRLLPLPCIHFP